MAGPWVPARRGKAPYLWILMIFFLLWKYLRVAPAGRELALLGATVLLFLPLYFASYWCLGPARALVISLTCLIGVLWAPHNFGASTFFIYACAMCAGIQAPRAAYGSLLAIVALALATAWGLPGHGLEFLMPVLIRSRRAFERDPAACRREIGDIERSALTALSEVHSAVSGYRQTAFARALAGARASLAAAGVEVRAEVPAFTLPAAAANVMSLALREAVTNIVRHAGATECRLSLALEEGVIALRIADHGARLISGAPCGMATTWPGCRSASPRWADGWRCGPNADWRWN